MEALKYINMPRTTAIKLSINGEEFGNLVIWNMRATKKNIFELQMANKLQSLRMENQPMPRQAMPLSISALVSRQGNTQAIKYNPMLR